MNRCTSRIGDLLVAAGLLMTGQAGLRAATVFDFNSETIGTVTTFSVTLNGITATFSSPFDPGGFQVGSPAPLAAPMNGNVLFDPGPAGDSGIPLDISFSQNLSSISLDFATDGPGTFDLSAFEGATQVGGVGVAGTIPTGFTFPQGTISFSGATFNNVILTSPSTPYFAIEDVAVVASVPEPAGFYLSAPILAALFGAARFSRKRRTTK